MEVLIKLSDAIKTLKSMAVPLVRKLPFAQPERLTDYSFEESCTECPAYDTENHRCPRFNQVIRTALKDANLEPCEDCISRQAAIDALENIDCSDGIGISALKCDVVEDAINAINALPSAQPTIIQCKDCKHNPKESWFGCPMSHLSEEQRPGTAWCWKGERKDDE